MTARKTGRKAIAFTLDALLAALLVTATYFVVTTIRPTTLSQPTTQYELLHYTAEDAMELFSLNKFSELNATTQQDLLQNGGVDSGDVNKSLVDIVTLLWSTNNISRASSVAVSFFNSTLPADVNYRLLIQELNGTTTVIAQQNATQPKNASVGYATKASRIVSGFKQNVPVNGYIARSVATQTSKNTSAVFAINPEGSGHSPDNTAMNITKYFYIPVNSTADIYKATFYLSIHAGTTTGHGEFRVNGNTTIADNAMDGLIEVQKTVGSESTRLDFGSKDIRAQLKPGWNSISITQKSNKFHSHIHPGTRIEVTYRTNETASRANPIIRTEYLDKILSDGKNGNGQQGGLWAAVPVYVPAGSTVHNITLYLNFTGVENNPTKNDIQVYFNGNSIRNVSAPSSNQALDVDLTSNVSSNLGKTNVVTVFADAYFSDENQDDSSFWNDDPMTMLSDPINNPGGSSRLVTNYSLPLTKKKYGYIDITYIEPFTGNRSNPKLFTTSFQNYDADNIFLHLAQLDSINAIVRTNYSGTTNTVFTTPMISSTPTKIFIDKTKVQINGNNTINVSDSCNSGGSCDILGNSSVEYQILVPSQVGYGETFSTSALAQADANSRLAAILAPYASILGVDLYTQNPVSSAAIPYLYGPVTVSLELSR